MFFFLFIPGFTILAFLAGSFIAYIAMTGRIEPADEESDSQPAH